MSGFKSAYLIHGDDHGRIAERRTRLKEMAEAQSGPEGIELFAGETSTPDTVASALNAMTFALGRRFLIVDGSERWKERELAPLLAVMAEMPPDTTVAFFAREDGRMKVPGALHEAVTRAGGTVAAENGLKPWELPKWVIAEARRLGVTLSPDAAATLIGAVGERQQRLLRELEKLALSVDPPAEVDADRVAESAAHSAERRTWSVADALLAGDAAEATARYLELRQQGERLPGLLFWMGSRLRQAGAAAEALAAGQSPGQVKRTLRMPSRAADQLLADARRLGPDRLRAAIECVADLELASRGGASGGAGEDTHAILAIRAIAGEGVGS